MNLRLDANSIRVRLTLAEAVCLKNEHEIRELLPVFGGEFHCSLRIGGSSLKFIENLNQKNIELILPKNKLEAMLCAILKSDRPKKEDCKVSTIVQTCGRSIEVRFEIDRFSLNNKGEKDETKSSRST